MDSQLTLADDSTLPDRYANTVLVFDQDSFLNATLRVRGGTMDVYAIRTERTGTRTELRMAGTEPGAEGALVVRIERNEILPDTIAFYDHPSVKISKWLKHRAFSVSTDSGPVRYVWKPLSRREIALFTEDNPFTPIAWFRTAHTSDINGVLTRELPYVALQPDAERIQDFVIASLMIVEHKYRMKDKNASIYASSLRFSG